MTLESVRAPKDTCLMNGARTPERSWRHYLVSLGIALGAAFGATFGVLLGNFIFGVAIGVVAGLLVGALADLQQKA